MSWHILSLWKVSRYQRGNQRRIQDFKLGGAHLYFVWKITILRNKIIFFPILGGGAPKGQIMIYKIIHWNRTIEPHEPTKTVGEHRCSGWVGCSCSAWSRLKHYYSLLYITYKTWRLLFLHCCFCNCLFEWTWYKQVRKYINDNKTKIKLCQKKKKKPNKITKCGELDPWKHRK